MLSRVAERQLKLQPSRTRWQFFCHLRTASGFASPRPIYGATEDPDATRVADAAQRPLP